MDGGARISELEGRAYRHPTNAVAPSAKPPRPLR